MMKPEEVEANWRLRCLRKNLVKFHGEKNYVSTGNRKCTGNYFPRVSRFKVQSSASIVPGQTVVGLGMGAEDFDACAHDLPLEPRAIGVLLVVEQLHIHDLCCEDWWHVMFDSSSLGDKTGRD